MRLKIYTDGASKGNPGLAGCGFVVLDEKDNVVYKQSFFLGEKTNNQAEYIGFLKSLQWVKGLSSLLPIDKVDWFLDSKLVVMQLTDKWKVKNPNILYFYNFAKQELKDFNVPFSITHVERSFNKEADKQANLSIKNRF